MAIDGMEELRQKRTAATQYTRVVPASLKPRKRQEHKEDTEERRETVVPAPESVNRAEPISESEQVLQSTIGGQVSESRTEDTPARPMATHSNGHTYGDGQAESSRQVTVYVLPEVKQSIARTAKKQKKTNATIALDALDAVQARLHELVVQRQSRHRPADSLFSTRRTIGKSSQGVPRDPFIIRVLASDFAVLEDLTHQHGARGVSELVSVALEAVYSKRR